MRKQIIDFIGTANYQGDDLGTYMWGNKTDGSRELIAIINGYNLDTEKNEGIEQAELFQNELGKFIAEAINEKITRDKLINPKLINDHTFQNFKISRRLLNCLYAMDIIYPIELKNWKREDVFRFRNFGLKSQKELDEFMEYYGIKFLGE
jgi:DNA-directed RNA polymerase alpha subunit